MERERIVQGKPYKCSILNDSYNEITVVQRLNSWDTSWGTLLK